MTFPWIADAPVEHSTMPDTDRLEPDLRFFLIAFAALFAWIGVVAVAVLH